MTEIQRLQRQMDEIEERQRQRKLIDTRKPLTIELRKLAEYQIDAMLETQALLKDPELTPNEKSAILRNQSNNSNDIRSTLRAIAEYNGDVSGLIPPIKKPPTRSAS